MKYLTRVLAVLALALPLAAAAAVTAPTAAAADCCGYSTIAVPGLGVGTTGIAVSSYEAIWNVNVWMGYYHGTGLTVDGYYGIDDQWVTTWLQYHQGWSACFDGDTYPCVSGNVGPATWSAMDTHLQGYDTTNSHSLYGSTLSITDQYSATTACALYNQWEGRMITGQTCDATQVGPGQSYSLQLDLLIADYQRHCFGSGSGSLGPRTYANLFGGILC